MSGQLRDPTIRWFQAAQDHPMRVALPDCHDARVIEAATRLAREGLALPTVIGALPTHFRQDAIEHIDPETYRLDERADDLWKLARGWRRPLSEEEASSLARDSLYCAAWLVRRGEQDGCVAGSSRPTAVVLRAGLRVIGLDSSTRTVSSSFLLQLPDGRLVAYGDCGVLPEPTAEQLADIASATARTFAGFGEEPPLVALLSFSTWGSSQHPAAEKMKRVMELLKIADPMLQVDGELQFDAAFDPSVARIKAPDSSVAGRANVYVFPSLDAANIAYKVTERIGRARAYGPLLQGLVAPLNDVSRGCSAEDLVVVSVLTGLQAGKRAVEGAGPTVGAP